MLPTSSALPPAGRANVEPQIEQEIWVDALSKIIASLPQSRQFTRKNFASPMDITSPRVQISSLSEQQAGEPFQSLSNGNSRLTRFVGFSPEGFGRGKPLVSRCDLTEPSLTPF